MTQEIAPLLVSFPGALAALGLGSRTTIYELVDRGELVQVHIGRRSFITAESLAAYVERLSEAAASA
jgi:hypothetical protein